MAESFFDGYALLIGVSENQAPGLALPAVANDVRALREVLVHPRRCAYAAENVRTLAGPQATRAGLLEGLAWLQGKLAAQAGGDATALVYYSGHGWRDSAAAAPAYYLIPCDFDPKRARLTALPAGDFAAEIAALSPRRLLVVLDCCHAGGMGVKDLDNPPGFVPAAIPPALFVGAEPVRAAGKDAGDLERLRAGQGRAALSSSRGDQSSYLRGDGSMSIFTYHLVGALTGHAEPKEGAREVLVSDIISHVTRRVPESAAQLGQVQQPEFQLSGDSFPVALLLGGEGLGKGAQPPDPLESLPKGAPPATVNTGGGPAFLGDAQIGNYVQGNQTIHLGDDRSVSVRAPMTNSSIVTGDKNKVRIQSGAGEAPSVEAFLDLLQELQEHIQVQAGQGTLGPEETGEVMADLARVEQQAQSEKPNGGILLKRLDSAVNFLANAATLAVSAPQIIELGRKLADWARVLFGA